MSRGDGGAMRVPTMLSPSAFRTLRLPPENPADWAFDKESCALSRLAADTRRCPLRCMNFVEESDAMRSFGIRYGISARSGRWVLSRITRLVFWLVASIRAFFTGAADAGSMPMEEEATAEERRAQLRVLPTDQLYAALLDATDSGNAADAAMAAEALAERRARFPFEMPLPKAHNDFRRSHTEAPFW